jgi:uncharacterized membrane protein
VRADTGSSARDEPRFHRRRIAAALSTVVAVAFAAGCAEGGGSDEASADSGDAAVGGWFLDVDWRAIGTEPFWGVAIGRDGLVFTEPAADPVRFPPAEPRRTDDGFTLSSTRDGRALKVGLRAVSCSDGMSDRQYDWAARVEVDGRRLEGCAIRDPLPTVISEDGPIVAAGLREHVESARRVRNEGGRYERVEGTLGRRRGADADFVAWFEGESIVAIDLRVARGIEPLFETSYYFGPSGSGGEPVVRLVDSDRWDEGTGQHTAVLIGFGPDGSLIGGLHEVDGRPTDPDHGVAEAELAGARDLVDAARAARME